MIRANNFQIFPSFFAFLRHCSNILMTSRACFRLFKMCSELSGMNVKSSSNEASLKRTFCTSDVKSETKSEEEILYEKAIATLNSLQTPYRSRGHNKEETKQQPARLTIAEKFAIIKRLPVDHLDKLAAIHVGGTKGKGSVCAFCESILRNSGYKTGFYSSPHLFEVRERMRINGKPISKKLFTRYFFECWENFEKEKKRYYLTFLVFMTFHVFFKEKVDVAIVEVGCGGEYDSTNVLRHPWVCGITVLDKDHLKFLGGSVESIAWHKSGIFKPGVPAFTVPQNPESMKVLKDRAGELKASLNIVPDLSIDADGNFPTLGIQGKHQHHNASLAVHLCRTWLERWNNGKIILNENEVSSNPQSEIPAYADVFPLPESFREALCRKFLMHISGDQIGNLQDQLNAVVEWSKSQDIVLNGLEKTVWPGRSQCIEKENFTFYVDGAHTRKSIEASSEWFCGSSREEKLRKSPKTMAKVLIFNFKGERDARSLLEPLVKCDFDYAIFCPNLLEDGQQLMTSDICRLYQDVEAEKNKCYKNEEIWRDVLHSNISSSLRTSEVRTRVFPCVSDVFHWLTDREVTSSDVITRVDHVQVFTTGSLYLVGMVLQLLKAEIADNQ